MDDAILDASALLALLNGEPGGDVVASHLPGALVSAVNLGEVVARLAEAGAPEHEIRLKLATLGLDIRHAGEADAYASGLLRPATRALGLSLGDRFCLALGKLTGLRVLTADQSWRGVDGIDIVVIR